MIAVGTDHPSKKKINGAGGVRFRKRAMRNVFCGRKGKDEPSTVDFSA